MKKLCCLTERSQNNHLTQKHPIVDKATKANNVQPNAAFRPTPYRHKHTSKHTHTHTHAPFGSGARIPSLMRPWKTGGRNDEMADCQQTWQSSCFTASTPIDKG